MYLLEFLFKKFKSEKKMSQEPVKNDLLEESPEVCEHIFLPIDSTKKVLACSKCGYVIKTPEPKKNKNFFIN